MTQPPKLIYFDMGNVLLHFDHEQACRQMAAVSGASPEAVWRMVFAGEQGLQWRYERGELSSGEFHAAYCEALGVAPQREPLLLAASDMFRLNVPVVPLLRQLRSRGHRLGILSNTCAAHWEFVTANRYRLFPGYFDVLALSYQLKAMKPDAECFRAAAELAGVAPPDIFYVDDRQDNVEGARKAGYQAWLFTTAGQLAADLRSSGVRLTM